MHLRFSLAAGRGSMLYTILRIHPEAQWSIMFQSEGLLDTQVELICYQERTHILLDRSSLFCSLEFAASGTFILDVAASAILDLIEQTSGLAVSWLNVYLTRKTRPVLQVLCSGDNLLLDGSTTVVGPGKITARYEIPVTYKKGRTDALDDTLMRFVKLIRHLSLQSIAQPADEQPSGKVAPLSTSMSISDEVVDGEAVQQVVYRDFVVSTQNSLLLKLFASFVTKAHKDTIYLTVLTNPTSDTAMSVILGVSSDLMSSTVRCTLPVKTKEAPARVSCRINAKRFYRAFERFYNLALFLGYHWVYAIVVTRKSVILSLFCDETKELVRCAIEASM